MLQRAARNAYSWWCASHIRTKQSKWLEQNLQDMEEKVEYILKMLEEDGDSFARRAEMYYRRRPELLNFVEDFFKSYKALAERYDYISKELQSANRTIATIYPERVHLEMDDEEDNNSDGPREKRNNIPPKDMPAPPKLSIPDVVSMAYNKKAKTSRLMSKKGLLKNNASDDFDGSAKSGLSKGEALEEIDKLQKQILALQTEKEFVKSSYENGLAKYWEIENQVTELQAIVTSLQDEFGIGTVIEDDEARTLMTSTALKSCQKTLSRIQEQQEKTDQEADIEHEKVQNAQVKFNSLVAKFESYQPNSQKIQLAEEKLHVESSKSKIQPTKEKLPDESSKSKIQPTEEKLPEESNKSKNQLTEVTKHGSIDLESLREKIKEDLQVTTSSHLTMSELAEKVDELVDKIISLESAVVVQNVQVNRLRVEADKLHANLQRAEEEKETLLKDSEEMSERIRELEEELQKVQNLNQTVTNQSKYIYTRITEASCKVDDLTGKLLNVLPDGEVKDTSSGKAGNTSGEKTVIDKNSSVLGDQDVNDKLKKDGSTSEISGDKSAEEKQMKDGNTDHGIYRDPSTHVVQDEHGTEDVEPNWKALFLNGLGERDKLLLEEYLSVLRNYKESKRKLNESEKKRRAAHFQYVVQIKVLRNSIGLKDAENQALLKKLNSHHVDHGETIKPSESTTKAGSEATDENTSKDGVEAKDENKRQKEMHRRTLSELLDVPIVEGTAPAREEATSQGHMKLPSIEENEDIKKNTVVENHAFSTIEEKVRTDIDELLEENMEFWLRFSTSFNQIRKFQSSVKDLQDELQKKRENKQQQGNKPLEQLSEIRPIYRHLKEIQTELTLWFEHSSVLKEDSQNRFSSLCNLQEEITKFSQEGPKEVDNDLSTYRAAKFQGEIINMKRENKKVENELQDGVNRVEKLQEEVRKTLQELDKLGLKRERKNSQSRIPLSSFLFGVKLKKQKQRSSLFACVSPALPKHSGELPRPK